MNISRIFLIAAVIISLTANTAFAAPVTNEPQQNSFTRESGKDLELKHDEEFAKDPIKALQNRKEKIQALLKEGKITKEKADEKIARIDSKIKEIESFNKLTLKQKKEKLIDDCRASVEKRVKEGKLDKAEADTILKNYTEKINKWDGKGYPHFHLKSGKEGKCKKHDT